jgi:hypothetical protein
VIDGPPLQILIRHYYLVNSYLFVDTLLLKRNKLTGTVPAEIGSLPRLSKYLPICKDMFMPIFRNCSWPSWSGFSASFVDNIQENWTLV